MSPMKFAQVVGALSSRNLKTIVPEAVLITAYASPGPASGGFGPLGANTMIAATTTTATAAAAPTVRYRFRTACWRSSARFLAPTPAEIRSPNISLKVAVRGEGVPHALRDPEAGQEDACEED